MAGERQPGFMNNAVRKVTTLPTLVRPASGGVTDIQLPDTGILAGLFLGITVTLSGTPTGANALGVARAIRNVRLKTNGGNDVFNASGVDYHYIIQQMLESSYFVAQGQNQGNSAVAAGTFNLDMYIPVQINLRDPVGLIMLQDQESIVTLDVDWAPATDLATSGMTVDSGSCQIHMVYYDVPARQEDLPAFNTLHQFLSDQRTLTGAIEHRVRIQTGGKYLQIGHGFGIGVSGSDQFTRFRTMINQSIQKEEWTAPVGLNQLHRYLYGRARPAGGIYVDYMGTAGLGNYGSVRDLLNSWNITQYEHLITSSNAGSVTLFTVRRQLMPLL